MTRCKKPLHLRD